MIRISVNYDSPYEGEQADFIFSYEEAVQLFFGYVYTDHEGDEYWETARKKAQRIKQLIPLSSY